MGKRTLHRQLLRAEIRRVDELARAELRRVDELARAEGDRVNGLFGSHDIAVNAAFAAQEKAVDAALTATEKAINKAEAAQANVNAGQNEFRGTLRDQAQTLMPRAEAEIVNREIRGIISQQAADLATLRSRLDVGPPALTTLQERSDRAEGQRIGNQEIRTFLAPNLPALLAGLLALAAIFAYLNKT